MAEAKKAPRRRKKPVTVKEKAARQSAKTKKPTRRKKATNAAGKGASTVKDFLTSDISVHDQSSDSKVSGYLTRNRSIAPSYLRGAVHEMSLVTWPSFKEAMRLTLAVFVFAIVFALVVSGIDWLLGKAFEEIILNESQNIREFINGLF
ncbi:MAG: preprotein translocase subunit SecE [Patescibacteria group bacterium]